MMRRIRIEQVGDQEYTPTKKRLDKNDGAFGDRLHVIPCVDLVRRAFPWYANRRQSHLTCHVRIEPYYFDSSQISARQRT